MLIWQVNLEGGKSGGCFFAILAPVVNIFYILMIVQIAAGALFAMGGLPMARAGATTARVARRFLCARCGGHLPVQGQ